MTRLAARHAALTIMRPAVLAIAGSDPSSGAGAQADLKAIEAAGVWAATALTAITVQGSRGVASWYPLPADLVVAQIEAVLEDFDVRAFKTGMLAEPETVRAVARVLGERASTVVVDPVLRASSGEALGAAGLADAIGRELLPVASLVTPNAAEAEALTGLDVRDAAGAERAGRELLDRGARAVLVKGGHFEHDRATDVLVTPSGTRHFRGEWISTPHGHGTGCTYASAIAARLALGMDLERAVEEAKSFTADALRHARAFASGRGPVDAMHGLVGTRRA